MLKQLTSAGLSVLFAAFVVSAQVTIGGNCSGRVFNSSEVTKRARITRQPKLDLVHGRVGRGARGRLVIDAVLCRNGHVTDIRVTEGMSREIDEFARAAIYMVKFEPAEHRWHTVSQRMRFELHFGPNEPGIKALTSADVGGRLVESVDIIGNRRLTAKQVFFWIETRPGEPYNEEQLKRDFQTVLASGYFDKTQTAAKIEDGVRGGVAVTFEVVELPLIGEINFEGLKVERAKVIEALNKENVKLQPEAVYDKASVKKAARVIELFLAANGQGDSNVEIRSEHVTAQKVNITFVIKPNQ